MSSNRKETQLYFENHFNCLGNHNRWINCNFPDYIVLDSNLEILKSLAYSDAKNYFFNGFLSLAQAIDGLRRSEFSWAVIQLYYCVYYLLRSHLYINNIILVRQKSLYLLEIKNGASPSKKNNKKYNSDHQGTLNHHIDLYKNQDILLSNKINDKFAYEWMLERREQINYRIAKFQDPKGYEFTNHFKKVDFKNNFYQEILKELDDPYIRCFQEETAVLSIPLKRLVLTYKELYLKLPKKSVLSAQQYLYIKDKLGTQPLLDKILNHSSI